MTNREYIESLTDEELAEYLNDEPWGIQCYQDTLDFGWNIIDAIETWLKGEYNGQ